MWFMILYGSEIETGMYAWFRGLLLKSLWGMEGHASAILGYKC